MHMSIRTTPDCISRLLDEAQHAKINDVLRSDKAVVWEDDKDTTIGVYGNEIMVRLRAINRLAAAGFVRIISSNVEFVTAIWIANPNTDAFNIISRDDERPHPFVVNLHQIVQRQIIVYGKSPDDVLADVYAQVRDGKISRLERSDDLHADIHVGCPFLGSDGAVARMFKKNLIARDPDGTLHDTNSQEERRLNASVS